MQKSNIAYGRWLNIELEPELMLVFILRIDQGAQWFILTYPLDCKPHFIF